MGSVAVAANVTTAPLGLVAGVVIFAGTVITGGSLSTTVTGNVALAVRPGTAEPVQVTVVVPRANTPGGGVQFA